MLRAPEVVVAGGWSVSGGRWLVGGGAAAYLLASAESRLDMLRSAPGGRVRRHLSLIPVLMVPGKAL